MRTVSAIFIFLFFTKISPLSESKKTLVTVVSQTFKESFKQIKL